MRKVGVIGLGYVGLPLAVAFAREGHEVIGVDVDARKVEALQAGKSYIEDVSDADLAGLGGRLQASTRYASLADAEAVLICVPTPLSRNREPDLGPLVEAGRALGRVLVAGQLVVLESTTYPGTTREVLVEKLSDGGKFHVGKDVFVAFSPERVDPG
ncbi:MAG: NAD(P)-binding domain-containing protein, partial [Solirubrobacteraceae bacterium]